jgi:hypothetical protein
MSTIQITKENAEKALSLANDSEKKLLMALLGQSETKATGARPENIIEAIKTFEDACAIAGEDPNDKKFTEGTKDEIAYKKLKVIVKVLNEGWYPNWENSDEYKYVPWFEYSSGSGFSDGGYDCWDAASGVGSRLCFKTRELAEYAANQFKGIYNDFLI